MDPTQKVAIEQQIHEIDFMIGELRQTTESYQMLSNVLIKKDPKKLIEDLEKQKLSLQKAVTGE